MTGKPMRPGLSGAGRNPVDARHNRFWLLTAYFLVSGFRRSDDGNPRWCAASLRGISFILLGTLSDVSGHSEEPFGSARPEFVEGLRINCATEESEILHLHFVPVQNDQALI